MAKKTAAPKSSPRKTAAKKSWTDKVNDPSKIHVVKKLDIDFSDMRAGEKMLIATPKIIHDYVIAIPKGKSVSMVAMRKDLANEYRADNTCPLTSGIFLRMVAEAAHEQIEKGASPAKVAPFWRVVDEKSPMNKKFTFGASFVKQQREKEGLIAAKKK